MNKENNIFFKAQDLEKWGQIYEPQLELKLDEAEIILDYMERQGFKLGCDERGGMIRLDKDYIEEYSLEEAIDKVCEWNYELVVKVGQKDRFSEDWTSFDESEYELLKNQEKKLDSLYDRTSMGAKINDFAKQLVEEFIIGANSKGIDAAISNIVDNIKESNAEKQVTAGRGR